MSTETPNNTPSERPERSSLGALNEQLTKLQNEIVNGLNNEQVREKVNQIKDWLTTNTDAIREATRPQLDALRQQMETIGTTFETTEMKEVWREVKERIFGIAQTTREQIGDVLNGTAESATSMWGNSINIASAGLGKTLEYLGKAAKFVGEKWQQLREMIARSMGGTLHALRDDNIFTKGLRASLEQMLGNYGTFYKTLEARKGDILITDMAENSAGKIVEMYASASQAGMQLTFEVFLNKTITKAADGFSLDTVKSVTYADLQEAARQVIQEETTNAAEEGIEEEGSEDGGDEEEGDEETQS